MLGILSINKICFHKSNEFFIFTIFQRELCNAFIKRSKLKLSGLILKPLSKIL